MTSASPTPDELTLLQEQAAAPQKENSLLRQKIDALFPRLFGESSEKVDLAQLELVLQLVQSSDVPEECPNGT